MKFFVTATMRFLSSQPGKLSPQGRPLSGLRDSHTPLNFTLKPIFPNRLSPFFAFEQARIIIANAGLIDPSRDRPHAQEIIRRGSQNFNASLAGQPCVMIPLAKQNRHPFMNGPREIVGGGHN
jgi:hypothetical protein